MRLRYPWRSGRKSPALFKPRDWVKTCGTLCRDFNAISWPDMMVTTGEETRDTYCVVPSVGWALVPARLQCTDFLYLAEPQPRRSAAAGRHPWTWSAGGQAL